MAFAGGARAQAPSATIEVSGPDDNNVRDGELTLREAVLLSEGRLTKAQLTPQERFFVAGDPGPGKATEIDLFSDVHLAHELPLIQNNETTILGQGHKITGNVKGAFDIRAGTASISGLEFDGGPQAEWIRLTSAVGPTRKYTFDSLRADDGKSLLNARMRGAGNVTFDLEHATTDASVAKSLVLDGEVDGEYDILHNHFAGALAGSVDLTLFGKTTLKYIDDHHAGGGTILRERPAPGGGKFAANIRDVDWTGGPSGLSADLRVAGELSLDHANFAAIAGAALSTKTDVSGVGSARVLANAVVIANSHSGWSGVIGGSAEFQSNDVTILGGVLGLNFEARAGANATLGFGNTHVRGFGEVGSEFTCRAQRSSSRSSTSTATCGTG